MASRRGFIWAVQQIDATTPLPEAAVIFARAGVPVFPCAPGGKQPVTGQGFKNATTDLAQVQAWWHRFPAANIGMPTGAASGAVVVDVDVHGPVNGYDALNRADRAGLVSGWGLAARSASGGLHLYFPATEGVEQRSWQAGRAAIDFRGDGGYIIVPPSAVTGSGSYEFVAGADRAPAPVDAARLRDFLAPRPEPAPHQVRGPIRSEDATRLAAWVGMRDEGERNRGLFWASCRLAEAGVDPTVTLDALGPAAEHAGLPPREVVVTIRSAYRATQPAPEAPSDRRSQGAGRWFGRTASPPSAALGRAGL